MKAEIFNCRCWVENTEINVLTETLNLLLQEAKYTVLNFVEHVFENNGYTSVWLLAESHLALHTFPEENKSYIELSGCNKLKTDVFIKSIQQKFDIEIV